MDAVSQRAATRPDRLVRWSLVAIWIVTALLLVLAVVPMIGSSANTGDSSALIFAMLVVLMTASFATVGALLALRRPRNPIGWLFVAGGVTMALALASQALVAHVYGSGGSLPSGVLVMAQIGSVLFQAGLVCAAVVVLVFPDGRLPRWGGVVLAVVVIAAVMVSTAQLLFPGPMAGQVAVDNPLALRGQQELLETMNGVANGLLVVGLGLAAFLLAGRYRRADADERKQLEWFAYVAVVLAASIAIATLPFGLVSEVAWFVGFGSFAALPIAIAIAVTRYHLYDIDVLINRTLVYVPLLALLAGLFAAGIAFFERLFLALTGDESDVAIVLTTLIVAIAFDPLRRQLEGLVDRWFKPVVRTPAVSGDVSLNDPRLEAYVEAVVRRVLEEKR